MRKKHRSKHALAVAVLSMATTSSVARADVILRDGVYGREHSLPLCDWSTEERTLLQFMADHDETWVCTSMDDRAACTWSGYAPSTSRYWFHPRHEPRWDGDTYYHEALDLRWPDATSLYGTWNMSCAAPGRRKPGPTPLPGRHRVLGSVIEGRAVSPTCTGADPARDVILAELDGGTVEHIRPGYVRGSVQIARSPYWAPLDDLRVAIQGYTDGDWHDLATTAATTTLAPETYAVEATVAELTDVRLQVRGRIRCNAQYGTGYDLRDARLFVEACVPDVSNPGECL